MRIPYLTRVPIPKCPSSMIFCGCHGVCSQTEYLYTDKDLVARGYDPKSRHNPDEVPHR